MLKDAQAQRHSMPFKEELNGLLSTLSDTGDTIERWFKVPCSAGCRVYCVHNRSLAGFIQGYHVNLVFVAYLHEGSLGLSPKAFQALFDLQCFLSVPRMAITPESFEWIGGRWKLRDFEPVSLLKGEILAAETWKRKKQEQLRADRERESRKRAERQSRQRQKLMNFLEKHNFDSSDVNAIGEEKRQCFALMTFYERPLHKAIKDNDVETTLLLVQYGADPMSKDSKGKTAYEYVKSSSLKTRMQTLHARTFTNGALSLC